MKKQMPDIYWIVIILAAALTFSLLFGACGIIDVYPPEPDPGIVGGIWEVLPCCLGAWGLFGLLCAFLSRRGALVSPKKLFLIDVILLGEVFCVTALLGMEEIREILAAFALCCASLAIHMLPILIAAHGKPADPAVSTGKFFQIARTVTVIIAVISPFHVIAARKWDCLPQQLVLVVLACALALLAWMCSRADKSSQS